MRTIQLQPIRNGVLFTIRFHMVDNVREPYPRVLVVEDDPAIRSLLLSALSREPLHIDAAGDGLHAARLAADHEYALLLVDFMLPHMSGVEFLQHFRALRPDSVSVVIVMTASDDQEVRRAGSGLIHGIVRKPFDLVRLVDTITAIATGWQSAARPLRPPRSEPWLTC